MRHLIKADVLSWEFFLLCKFTTLFMKTKNKQAWAHTITAYKLGPKFPLQKKSNKSDSTLCKFSSCLPRGRVMGRWGGKGGDILCNISLIYCLLGYIRIYMERKEKNSALNINPACWTCTVISILYFQLLLYIKSMLLICAFPFFLYFF